MKKKKVAFHNLGCKVNAYETEAMQQMLLERGYEIVPFDETADIYIVNTCTVTNIADRKSRQMLHRAKKKNPDAIVAAVGCYAQAAVETLAKDAAVDLVIGNNRKKDLADILQQYEMSRKPECYLEDLDCGPQYETLGISRTTGHTRAYIKVQDGCNQFCSYCAIPYARGRVRSRAVEDVLAEVRALAANGYQEVVLTGIHLSSYGTEKKDGIGLLQLILALQETEGIRRIRLGSLEPRVITEEFVKTLHTLPKICPHFHLSLQSGSDAVLRRMNRHYTAGEYYEKCELLRAYFTHPAITTDVITGFPGETEEEFEETVRFLKKVKFYETHIFPYSKRKGTRAAQMPQQIPEKVKHARSLLLQGLDAVHRKEYEAYYKGKKVEVLFEEKVMRDGQTCYTGHTREYLTVTVPSEQDLTNKICDCIL